jgi:CTP synthase (UTP-ammonia lyase)
MKPSTIALVGDYSSDVIAHQAIPRALVLASAAAPLRFEWQWVPTRDIRDADSDLRAYAAIWVVPASPYKNMNGALAAIRFARETARPFLGTCGGFQHALIEFGRSVAGLTSADHAETNPDGDSLVVAPLACSLVEKTGQVHLARGTRLRAIYGQDRAEECYHCNYGVNPAYRERLACAGMRFSAFDDSGEPRAAELATSIHPFFIGTLFQPERAALRGAVHPLIRAFVAAACAR